MLGDSRAPSRRDRGAPRLGPLPIPGAQRAPHVGAGVAAPRAARGLPSLEGVVIVTLARTARGEGKGRGRKGRGGEHQGRGGKVTGHLCTTREGLTDEGAWWEKLIGWE